MEANIIIIKAKSLFPQSLNTSSITLRGGNGLDDYKEPPTFEPIIDRPDDEYLSKYHYGLNFLDPLSWQYYLPIFIDYSLRHIADGGNIVVDSFLSSLRPPDREPPRFASLSKEQEQVIVDFLDYMAFENTSEFKDYSMQVLEEYWIPGALYREKE